MRKGLMVVTVAGVCLVGASAVSVVPVRPQRVRNLLSEPLHDLLQILPNQP